MKRYTNVSEITGTTLGKEIAMEYLEITENDDSYEVMRKSRKNMNMLQENALSVWRDFKNIDLSNGDRKCFANWIISLFDRSK